ncbi:MAG: hypothetical protein KJN98_06385, partial [Pontiella sp.]|nr:hypothetical protein [Pontiella sp.]
SEQPLPTHADAALMFAKYSGMFDRYVSADATLNDCVAFLNKTGVYFGLMEVVNGTEFAIKDCARVMGQIELILSGEAEYLLGKVKLPKGIDSWEDFCVLNGVEYIEGYEALLQSLASAKG